MFSILGYVVIPDLYGHNHLLTRSRFHTLKNHSPWVSKLGLKFDLQGIVILIWGASVPLTYYGFHCDRKLQWAYWSLVRPFDVLVVRQTYFQ
jgi:adiponectin receptor